MYLQVKLMSDMQSVNICEILYRYKKRHNELSNFWGTVHFWRFLSSSRPTGSVVQVLTVLYIQKNRHWRFFNGADRET